MTASTSVKCPQCGHSFEISQVIGESIRSQVREEEQQRFAERLKQLDERSKLIEQREKDLVMEGESFEKLVSQRLKTELDKQIPALKQQIQSDSTKEMTDLKNQLTEKDAKLTELESGELELRKKIRELAEASKNQELEVQRRVDLEREKIVAKQHEELDMLISQKDKVIGDLNEQMLVLQSKAEQDREEAQQKVSEKLKQLDARTELIAQRERDLVIEGESFEKLVAQRLKTELDKQIPTLKQKIQSDSTKEMSDLKNQLNEKDAKLTELENGELELRKKIRELAEASKNQELEVQRRVDLEREKIVAKQHEEVDVLVSQKEKVIGDLREQISILQKKAEQLPQKIQGEAAELRLEDLLRYKFPQDHIEPVASGVRGADILQTVMSSSGIKSGSILWESKDTKTWQEAWVKKAKDDQLEAKADYVIICSAILPKDVESHEFRSGVLITNHLTAMAICLALRQGLLEIGSIRQSQQGMIVKAEMMYAHITGSEFKQRFGIAVDTFAKMWEQLQKEKRSMQASWSKREGDLQRVLENLSSLYGGLQSIAGASLPEIDSLELKPISDTTDNKMLTEESAEG